ncbi:MAG: hypothetical protein AMS21_12660 [Gemmatimonas sp. SG8_38_2]|nr:MAG: hypothetical protein AMS21_12660 [Gemmatimonas sp. SG8_38_2]
MILMSRASRSVSFAAVLSLLLLSASQDLRAQDDTSNQIWADVILAKPLSGHFQGSLGLEGRTEFNRESDWGSLRGAPTLQYFVTSWLDLVGEVLFAFTKESADLNSLQVTPRVGFELHLNNEVLQHVGNERVPLTRFDLYNLARLEYRAFWYSDDTASSQEWRFRNRAGGKIAINRKRLSEARTLYATLDFEIFIPVGDKIPETFASKYRVRAGLGYRLDYNWRFEAMYVFDESRNTLEDDFSLDSNVLDLRVKRFF